MTQSTSADGSPYKLTWAEDRTETAQRTEPSPRSAPAAKGARLERGPAARGEEQAACGMNVKTANVAGTVAWCGHPGTPNPRSALRLPLCPLRRAFDRTGVLTTTAAGVDWVWGRGGWGCLQVTAAAAQGLDGGRDGVGRRASPLTRLPIC